MAKAVINYESAKSAANSPPSADVTFFYQDTRWTPKAPRFQRPNGYGLQRIPINMLGALAANPTLPDTKTVDGMKQRVAAQFEAYKNLSQTSKSWITGFIDELEAG